MDWDMTEDHAIQNAIAHHLLEASLGIFLVVEDVMVAEDQSLMTVKPPHNGQELPFHGYVTQEVNVVLWSNNLVMALDHNLIHLLGSFEPAQPNH